MAGPEPPHSHGHGHCVHSKLGLSQHWLIEVRFCDYSSQILRASWQPMFTMIVLAEMWQNGRGWYPPPLTPPIIISYVVWSSVCVFSVWYEDNLARHSGAWCVQCKHTGETRLLASQPFVWQKSYIQCHLLYIQYTRHVIFNARESEDFYIHFLKQCTNVFLQFISLMKHKRYLCRSLILFCKIAFSKTLRQRTNKVVC